MDYKYKASPTKKIRLKVKDIHLISQIARIDYNKPGRFRIKAVFGDGTHSEFCYEKKITTPSSKEGDPLSFKLTFNSLPKSFYTKKIKPPKMPGLGVSTQKRIQHPLNILATDQKVPENPLCIKAISEELPAHPLNFIIKTINK